MKKLNVICVFNKDKDKILMCKREKNPFKGKYNLVGGKVEKGESKLDAAYRELQEETGIKKEDISLKYLMNFQYIFDDYELEIYSGKLEKDVEVTEELNKLCWIDVNENFFDYEKFAGEGNIGHMLRQIEIAEKKVDIWKN